MDNERVQKTVLFYKEGSMSLIKLFLQFVSAYEIRAWAEYQHC